MNLVDAALKNKITKFVLMSSLLTNGKEAGQSLNPGMRQTSALALSPAPKAYHVPFKCNRGGGSDVIERLISSMTDCHAHAGYIFLNLFGNVLNEKLAVSPP